MYQLMYMNLRRCIDGRSAKDNACHTTCNKNQLEHIPVIKSYI